MRSVCGNTLHSVASTNLGSDWFKSPQKRVCIRPHRLSGVRPAVWQPMRPFLRRFFTGPAFGHVTTGWLLLTACDRRRLGLNRLRNYSALETEVSWLRVFQCPTCNSLCLFDTVSRTVLLRSLFRTRFFDITVKFPSNCRLKKKAKTT